MSFEQDIQDQEAEIVRCEASLRQAKTALSEAKATAAEAAQVLLSAQARHEDLKRLSTGKSPYLCGTPYATTFQGDAYQTTTISGIKKEVHWWVSEEAQKNQASPYPHAYIVALENDAKTWKALLYLRESANIEVATLRKLLKLPPSEL